MCKNLLKIEKNCYRRTGGVLQNSTWFSTGFTKKTCRSKGGGGQKCPKFRPHGLWMPPAYLYRLSLTFGRSSLLACACQHSLWMFPYPILIAIRKIKVSRFSHSIENIFLWLNSRSTSTRNLFIRTLTEIHFMLYSDKFLLNFW